MHQTLIWYQLSKQLGYIKFWNPSGEEGQGRLSRATQVCEMDRKPIRAGERAKWSTVGNWVGAAGGAWAGAAIGSFAGPIGTIVGGIVGGIIGGIVGSGVGNFAADQVNGTPQDRESVSVGR